MALTDNLKLQIYPQAGDTAIKNIVDDSVFGGTGTPTLVDEGAEKAWSIPAGTFLTAALPSKVLGITADGGGVTIAMRFKRTTTGTDIYMPFVGVTSSGSAAGTGVRFTSFDANRYRGRVAFGAEAATTAGTTNGTELTVVYRAATLAASTSPPNQDNGSIWKNTTGRVGTDPDAQSYGNMTALTIAQAFINCQTGAAWTLLDYAYWDRELTNAECASVADNYRAVMPAPGAGTPILFTGTVPDQVAVVGTPFSLSLAGYFSGSMTPFSYALQSGTLPDGITLDSGTGEISGTPTGIDTTTIVVRATDSGGNTADTNSFTIEVNWAAQVPQGTVTLGTPTGITSSSAAIPYSYSAADQTGFEYRVNGGSPQTVTTSPLVVTGLTAATAYTVEMRAVNAVGAGTWSSPANFTTSAAALPPQGTFTIGTITAGQTTASVPYTYSASDQTSIQYRINGGSAVTATASPQALSGLTASTVYTIEFRAVNANGNGNWSTPANFNTQAAPVAQGTITLSGLKNNTGTQLTSQSGYTVDVYNLTTGALVVRKAGLTTTDQAALVVTDEALVAGTEYRCIIHNGTAQGVVRAVAA